MEILSYSRFVKLLEKKTIYKTLNYSFIMEDYNIEYRNELRNIIDFRKKYLESQNKNYFNEICFSKQECIESETSLLINLFQPFLLFIDLHESKYSANEDTVIEIAESAFQINKLLNNYEKKFITNWRLKHPSVLNYIQHFEFLMSQIVDQTWFINESECPLFLIIEEWLIEVKKIFNKKKVITKGQTLPLSLKDLFISSEDYARIIQEWIAKNKITKLKGGKFSLNQFTKERLCIEIKKLKMKYLKSEILITNKMLVLAIEITFGIKVSIHDMNRKK